MGVSAMKGISRANRRRLLKNQEMVKYIFPVILSAIVSVSLTLAFYYARIETRLGILQFEIDNLVETVDRFPDDIKEIKKELSDHKYLCWKRSYLKWLYPDLEFPEPPS